METEELTRLVDGIYKNILDKFNPGARQLINAGKAYLKALHGAAAASRVYVDALSRLARQAQLGTWGGSQDVGSALMRIVEVYKEIQEQEMNILKAFYVDLLVPLETNLEKDTKVVQSEQKKFLQQHKTRSETYSKAAATMKKQRKKSRGASKSGLAMDKELKNMQILEEEKSKLDAFCEQSLKNAMTQERRRYGFVLERQCSLAKHYASFHEVALAALHPSVDEWREVANTREYLPQSVEDMFASRLRQVSFWPEDEENGGSELTMSSQLRKTRSMDSSCLELRLGPPPSHPPSSLQPGAPPHLSSALSRARSEANIHASSLSLEPEAPETPPRPRSMAPPSRNSIVGSAAGSGGTGINSGWGEASLARALFAYLSSGENQLSFLEGDLIALMGDRQKGWQFGENLRTQSSGWFPLAYTEIFIDDSMGSPSHGANNGRSPEPRAMPPCKPPPSRPPPTIDELSNGGSGNTTNNNVGNVNMNSSTPTNVPKSHSSHNVATPTGRQPKSIRPSGTMPSLLAAGRRVQPPVPPVPPPQGVTSLHSSNDSGFSNEPPVQPDIDYSDDEAMRQRRRKTRGERLEAAERAKQQSQHTHQEIEEKSKDWENDSWKTIPRDEKSWQMYRTAMDLWSESKSHQSVEKRDLEGRYGPVNGRRSGDNQEAQSKDYSRRSEYDLKDKRDRKSESGRKTEYTQPRGKGEAERNGRYVNGNDRQRESNRRSLEERRECSKRGGRDDEESEDEEREVIINEDDDNYDTNEYSSKYGGKKYYDNHSNDSETRRYHQERDDHKYKNEKSESVSSTSDSEDASTITIPETGRKVEHIAQKLEQTAQKYAREHSPPKFADRRREEYRKSLEREEKPSNYDKYERETRSMPRFDRERYQEKNQSGYERERTFEKNPDRKKNERSSNRRFERPKPPFEEAPDIPRERPTRERRYSEKEEIYGETTRFSRRPGTLEKDRGYESNFETKLERNKVLEKVAYAKSDIAIDDSRGNKNATRSPVRNDTNNNTLKNDKHMLVKSNTSPGQLIQSGKNFDVDIKSPKLIKRTKSFWRFRRDSEVLEGMALWQHRSLVDIPKMIKRESKEERVQDDANVSRKSSPDNNSGSGRSASKDSRSSDNTITNDHNPRHSRQDPKPAERTLTSDKGDYFDDFPTPAERPKAVERTEYRIQREERSYFVGNISRKAILEKERKRSLEAKRSMVVAELKENNEAKKGEHRNKSYGDDDDGLIQNFSETEASDEESTYSCIVEKDQQISEKTLLPRTKLRRESDREKNTCGPWYDLWGADASVNMKKQK
ncbi:trichohyalin isoform X2 [Chelonus insularis]|uniref:trichohyalin isoform X2 n=1 Tax=Chelonus insularis TaxID=460826 RepID=UPI00158C05DB|nr:trichohyalin isoform X2 [Chelonus insularis]